MMVFLFLSLGLSATDPETLAIGSKAPDFSLPGVDGKTYALSSFESSGILLIVFT